MLRADAIVIPPLRTRIPSGAPVMANSRQAKASVNFL